MTEFMDPLREAEVRKPCLGRSNDFTQIKKEKAEDNKKNKSSPSSFC